MAAILPFRPSPARDAAQARECLHAGYGELAALAEEIGGGRHESPAELAVLLDDMAREQRRFMCALARLAGTALGAFDCDSAGLQRALEDRMAVNAAAGLTDQPEMESA